MSRELINKLWNTLNIVWIDHKQRSYLDYLQKNRFIFQLIQAWTNWPPFSRWHLQKYFLNWPLLYFGWNFIEIWSRCCNFDKLILLWIIYLRQIIIWTSIGLIVWHHGASMDYNAEVAVQMTSLTYIQFCVYWYHYILGCRPGNWLVNGVSYPLKCYIELSTKSN